MEDTLNAKSNESLATSDQFDIIGDTPSSNKTPTLDLSNEDISKLTTVLTEVLKDTENNITEIEQCSGSTARKNILYESHPELPRSFNTLDEQVSVKPDTSSEESSCSEFYFLCSNYKIFPYF